MASGLVRGASQAGRSSTSCISFGLLVIEISAEMRAELGTWCDACSAAPARPHDAKRLLTTLRVGGPRVQLLSDFVALPRRRWLAAWRRGVARDHFLCACPRRASVMCGLMCDGWCAELPCLFSVEALRLPRCVLAFGLSLACPRIFSAGLAAWLRAWSEGQTRRGGAQRHVLASDCW